MRQNFDHFDADVTAEEIYGHADVCLNCYCEPCECEEAPLPSPCVLCGLVFGQCDCDGPSPEELERDRRLFEVEDLQYDRAMYEETDLLHEW
jgi:hypothetical protein